MTETPEKSQGEVYQQMMQQALAALRDLDRGDETKVLELLADWTYETPARRLLMREIGLHGEKILIPANRQDHDFYHPPLNCQIPNIGAMYEALFGRRRTGWFVEAGGYDGESYSNTSFLADLGWQGVYVEPVPDFAEFCRRRHRVNPQVQVAEVAIGAAEGTLEMYIADVFTSAEPEQIDTLRQNEIFANFITPAKVTVPMRTLDQVLTGAGVPAGFDLLVLDLEGYELEAMLGFSLDEWRPSVVILETADRHKDLVGTDFANRSRLCREILNGSYTEVWTDSVNNIYLRQS